MNEVELYDHSVKMNTDLFQIYFGMSKSLAGEINYLDQKDDEIEQIMRQQIAEGDMSARNARRRSENG